MRQIKTIKVAHLRNVLSTENVSPAPIICLLQRSVAKGTEVAALRSAAQRTPLTKPLVRARVLAWDTVTFWGANLLVWEYLHETMKCSWVLNFYYKNLAYLCVRIVCIWCTGWGCWGGRSWVCCTRSTLLPYSFLQQRSHVILYCCAREGRLARKRYVVLGT